jgi:hypothetical protein
MAGDFTVNFGIYALFAVVSITLIACKVPNMTAAERAVTKEDLKLRDFGRAVCARGMALFWITMVVCGMGECANWQLCVGG